MRAQFPTHKVITDVGSGINFKRKGLRTLLDEAQRGRIRQVVVAHRDRLCRFAFELVEWILAKGGATLLVQNGKQDLQQEFSEDLLAIVHVFSCRFNGMRRYKRVLQAYTEGEGEGEEEEREGGKRKTPEESADVSNGGTDKAFETVDGSQQVVIQSSGLCAQPEIQGKSEAENAGKESQAPMVLYKSSKRYRKNEEAFGVV